MRLGLSAPTETIGASVVAAFTMSGATALRIARQRPDCGILGLTPSIETARRLALVWGVHAVVSDQTFTMTETVARATTLASRAGKASRGVRLGDPLRDPAAELRDVAGVDVERLAQPAFDAFIRQGA